ncbi:hypothetical protein HRV97_00620 [Sphingomonas sp. HHU CXW]|uniref:Secreted protein n=1 Tax=Sphingomonas hominis TaxID=2741495 RepID=A0ABX2JGY4_9SPHN|nr:hypothetical protein [Sphingomonas hominis]NTS63659.1 hypothetical protein [Sphingomonas hominis]
MEKMMTPTMRLAAAGLTLTLSTAAIAEPVVPRGYAVTYEAGTDRYCIRFFSDTLLDPRPNTSAPDCRTKADWARHKVFVQHRRGGK